LKLHAESASKLEQIAARNKKPKPKQLQWPPSWRSFNAFIAEYKITLRPSEGQSAEKSGDEVATCGIFRIVERTSEKDPKDAVVRKNKCESQAVSLARQFWRCRQGLGFKRSATFACFKFYDRV
jgi:hypothetical protein